MVASNEFVRAALALAVATGVRAEDPVKLRVRALKVIELAPKAEEYV